MKLKNFLFGLGIVLILAGTAVIAWFFFQNWNSEKKMDQVTDEFVAELQQADPIPVEAAASQTILEGSTIAVLEFPAFDNERIAVKEGSTNSVLAIAAGHMKETEQVWAPTGNCAIAAHNNTFFKNVKNFGIGDKILVYTRVGVYEYTVYDKLTVEPTETSVLEDVPGQKILTLITCNFSGEYRIIIKAKGGVRIADPQTI